MRVIRAVEIDFIPATHEDPADPGVVKRVLFRFGEISDGHIQMVNWCLLSPRRSFEPHFHETMDEIFIIVSGTVDITIGNETDALSAGDAVYVPERSVHMMANSGDDPVTYLAIGISHQQVGKSVNTRKPPSGNR